MFEKYFLKKLKPEEKLVKVIRHYYLTLFGIYFLSSALIVAAFFLLYPLLRWGLKGFIIFLFLILAGLVIALRQFLIWSLNAFLVTNKRIVDFDQNGLFSRNVTEATFDNIQDISYNKKGVLATIFGYGSVVIKTASEDSNLELKNVRNPDEVQDMLVDCQSKFSRKK